MENEKIGIFIKKLRTNRKWSQEVLANKIYCSRLKIHRIENGIQYPDLDDLIALSNVFNVSIEELVYGELKTKNNQEMIKSHFLSFLKFKNSKFKKIQLITCFLVILSVLLFFIMISIYFFQNYRTLHIYKFYGSSENYEITDGLLVLSKDKIYFVLPQINPEVKQLEIYSKIDNDKNLIYKGSAQNVLRDFYGYNALFSYDDFLSGKQEIYLIIDDEEIMLHYEEEFVNDSFWNIRNKKISSKEKAKNEMIPKKIAENFNCINEFCVLEKKDESLTYNSGILIVVKEKKQMIYDTVNNVFTYQANIEKDNECEFTMTNKYVQYVNGNCENAKEIFAEFTQKYIHEYLE